MRLYRSPLPRRVTENAPIAPPDLVHLSHLYGELLLDAYRALGISGAAARLGIVHGVGPVMKSDPRFLPVPLRFCLQAARRESLTARTGVDTLHAFLHIEDAVDGLLHLRDASPEVLRANIAAEVLSVSDVAQAVERAGRARGIGVTIRYDGHRRRYGPRTVGSALDASGFQSRRRLEDHIAEVLEHYIADRPG
jgi:nucleoside-diphosphate-sugar epimerase